MPTLSGSTYIIMIDTVTPTTALTGNVENYRPVVCGTSNGFNLSIESIQLRNKDDGGWDKTKAGYGTWGLDLSGYAIGIKNSEISEKVNFQEIAKLAADKREFWARMGDVDGKMIREGVVRISSYNEVAPNEEAYTFSITFTGLGKPRIIFSFYTVVLAANADESKLITDGKNNLIENNYGN